MVFNVVPISFILLSNGCDKVSINIIVCALTMNGQIKLNFSRGFPVWHSEKWEKSDLGAKAYEYIFNLWGDNIKYKTNNAFWEDKEQNFV